MQFLFKCICILSLSIVFIKSSYAAIRLEQIYENCSNQNTIHIGFIREQFKMCNSIDETENLYQQLLTSISNPECLLLIEISYINTIDKFGNHKRSLQLIKNKEPEINSFSTIVKSEWNALLGQLAIRVENPNQALTYYELALSDALLSKDLFTIQSRYINLGVVYNALNLYDSAIVMLQKALLFDSKESHLNESYLKLNLAVSYMKTEKLEKAKGMFLESIPLLISLNDNFAQIRSYCNVAEILLKQDSLQVAEKFYLKADSIAILGGFVTDQIRIYRELSLLNERKGNFKQAYTYFKWYDSIRNNQQLSDVSQSIASLEYQHQLANEKMAIESQEKIIEMEKNRNNWFVVFIIILIVVLIIIVWQYVLLKTKTKILLKQNIQNVKEKSVNTQVSSEEESRLIKDIEFLISTNKFYKEKDITIEILAKRLLTNRTYLSEVINSHYKMNFSKWINELRVNEARMLLANKENNKYSIEAISEQVGFASLSAFNTNFKRVTGLTPSYFREGSLSAENHKDI
jgi:AraC-like DNA-binding protein